MGFLNSDTFHRRTSARSLHEPRTKAERRQRVLLAACLNEARAGEGGLISLYAALTARAIADASPHLRRAFHPELNELDSD